jgi:hypothetical protein
VQRHRTNIVAGAYMLVSDIRGFVSFSGSMATTTVERSLNALDGIIHKAARDLGVRSTWALEILTALSFPDAAMVIAAA